MTVVAIRCEACDGTGEMIDPGNGRQMSRRLKCCPLCNGTGTETPPQDHDKDARRAIEGASDDA